MTRSRPCRAVRAVPDEPAAVSEVPAAVPVVPAATVTVYPDGPLVVRGDFAVQGVDGTEIDTGGAAVALCRCGRSAVKPLCDGSHKLARRRRAQQASAAGTADSAPAS